jgi:hypothetical protein
MASNLAGATCIGQHSTCLLRAAKLDSDCTVTGGADSGIVTTGIVTATFTPEYTDTRTIEPLNGCGDPLFSFVQPGKFRRGTVAGEIGFHDWEMMEILFGGTLVEGIAGGPFAGEVIGWAAPSFDDPVPDPVYLEIIVKNQSADQGECVDPDNPYPTYTGYIFGKTRLTVDAQTYNDAELMVPFTGTAEPNPNLVFGPWNDWPGDGVVPNSPKIEVGYSQAQWETIAAMAACGYKSLPTPYS